MRDEHESKSCSLIVSLLVCYIITCRSQLQASDVSLWRKRYDQVKAVVLAPWQHNEPVN